MFTSSLPRVHVVGANVYGYTTAILLLLQGYKVTIIAKQFPGDAGYHSDDMALQMDVSDTRTQHYDTVSYKMFWHLAARKAAESGLMIGNSFKYYEDPTEDYCKPQWEQIVPGFEMIEKQELPKGVQLGYHYPTVMVNTNRYLSWLQTQFLSMGGRQRNATLESILSTTALIVRCDATTAQESKKILQEWTVRASQIRNSVHVKTKHGDDMYLYPRLDGTVVFGIRSAQTILARDLLEKISSYCPELMWGKGLDGLVVEDGMRRSIGLDRPRVENQYMTTHLGTRIAITHNYGHQGYQSSWGAAQCAVRLVNEAHGHLKKDSQSVTELLSHL